MGIRFNSNTWRAPLQLIDCWLPAPAVRQAPAANEPFTTRAMRRFARAGWLGRKTADTPSGAITNASQAVSPAGAVAHPSCRVRVLRQVDPLPARAGAVRLVISGRISDVCAELDRLADQETQVAARVA
ncbi:hypothetical protein [Hydrogenophaga sp.]|uniref:hypothetical protein n=1 Tax=Hydrogenophaga sp. TaxID=1904254 RepID=UPI002633E2E0|nr:hypothetical protein [Hydrogenophaga sp.]MCW5652310.1 hypothetical protein [Hydrogenophaga sp.]